LIDGRPRVPIRNHNQPQPELTHVEFDFGDLDKKKKEVYQDESKWCIGKNKGNENEVGSNENR
jgi:hypothetical protein